MKLKHFWLVPAGSFSFLFSGALLLGSLYFRLVKRDAVPPHLERPDGRKKS